MSNPRPLQPARADCLHLPYATADIRCLPILATQDEHALARLALNSYGHCLRTESRHYPSNLSMGAFADAIARVYCEREPRHAAVVSALRSVHSRMVNAERACQLL